MFTISSLSQKSFEDEKESVDLVFAPLTQIQYENPNFPIEYPLFFKSMKQLFLLTDRFLRILPDRIVRVC